MHAARVRDTFVTELALPAIAAPGGPSNEAISWAGGEGVREAGTEVQAAPAGPWPWRMALNQAGVVACWPVSLSQAFPATGRDGLPSCPVTPPGAILGLSSEPGPTSRRLEGRPSRGRPRALVPGAAHQVLLRTQQQPGSEKDEEASGEIPATLVQGLCDLGCHPYPHCYPRAEVSLTPRKVQPMVCLASPTRGPH